MNRLEKLLHAVHERMDELARNAAEHGLHAEWRHDYNMLRGLLKSADLWSPTWQEALDEAKNIEAARRHREAVNP